MKKFSLFDRKFLASYHIGPADVRVFHDDAFRQSIGVAAEDGYGSDTSQRLMDAFLRPLASPPMHDETQVAYDAKIQALADRIAKHEAPIQLDGTQRLMVGLGLDPYDRSEYLRLAFMGSRPAELDGEIEAELPDGIRLQDADDIGDAPSAGFCGEPSHGPAEDPDEDAEED
jgi:hypothetical protein